MLGILKKNDAGYISGVIDHLVGNTEIHLDKMGKYKENNLNYRIKQIELVSNSPVEQQQQCQHRQISGGDIGILLKTNKDDDNQCGWDDVVTLQERKRPKVKNFYQIFKMTQLYVEMKWSQL